VIHLARLDEAIKATGVQIDGVNADGLVAPASLQAAAQPTIDAFDDSASAQAAWDDAKEPFLVDIKAQAQGAIDENTAFLAIASPTNAQTLAQVKRLAQQNTRIIKALARVVVRTWR
jgi:hypothetical protein